MQIITNLPTIAQSISRSPNHLLKHFGYELGAQTNTKNDLHVISGYHTKDRLQTMLNTFIDRYVLCKKCGNPETLLVSSIYYEKKRMVCRKYVKMYRKYAKLVGTSIVLRQTS